jgi:phosphopantothenoylcysteine decarboxylase/phosphopantothenate--cysteine ligase
MLRNKKIIVGVCGSIAAYKTAFLIRLLVKEGAEVKVVMTSSASSFITPLTLSTLSKNPVYFEFSNSSSGEWHNHVELGLWADLFIVAPATANSIGKFANGICDNFLTAVYLSAKAPIWIAPAMDLDMYQHPSVKSNLQELKSFGNRIIDAEYGELASGLVGQGRMEEPEVIVELVKKHFEENKKLAGKRVLVTAGPTYEAIDPVRFIGNHSSGKMGYEIASALKDLGAQVILISGPTSLPTPEGVERVDVRSAAEMYEKAKEQFPNVDIAVLAAAVADFTPENVADKKIKKQEGGLEIKLKKTTDIAAELGMLKRKDQFIVGFALETDNEESNALKKLQSKNFDMVVLNSLKDQGAGFAYDTNKITILTKDNKKFGFELKSKKEVALDIVNTLLQLIHV